MVFSFTPALNVINDSANSFSSEKKQEIDKHINRHIPKEEKDFAENQSDWISFKAQKFLCIGITVVEGENSPTKKKKERR